MPRPGHGRFRPFPAPAPSSDVPAPGTPGRPEGAPVPAGGPWGPSAQAPVWRPVPPEARKRRGTLGWDILFGFDLLFIGLMGLFAVGLYIGYLSGNVDVGATYDSSELVDWIGLAITLTMFGLVPLVWVIGTRVGGIRGALRYLRLDRPMPGIAHGFGYAALLLGLVLLMSLLIEILGVPVEETGGEQRFTGMTLSLIMATSVVAGFGEEVFFRGILQKWIGVWGQAVVFGLYHIPGGLLAFFVTGSIGLLFGLLVKRGRSLWLVITAHFAYDAALLLLIAAA